MPVTVDAAICLRQHDWSETSQTAVLLTRTHGLIRGLAKGARRPGAAFDGGIEALGVGQIGAIFAPNKDLLTLTSWSCTRHHAAIRRSLSAYAAASFMADLTRRLLAPMDAHPDLADALIFGLDRLDAARHDAAADHGFTALQFAWTALVSAGFAPALPGVAVEPESRGRTGGASRAFEFSPDEGDFLKDPRHGRGGETWRVRAVTVRLLNLARSNTNPGDAQGVDIARAIRFLTAWVEWRTGTAPQSGEFLASVIGRQP